MTESETSVRAAFKKFLPPPPHPSPHPHARVGEARHLVSHASPNLTSEQTATQERCCCNRLFQRERTNWLRQSTIIPQTETKDCQWNSGKWSYDIVLLLQLAAIQTAAFRAVGDLCCMCNCTKSLYRYTADQCSANSTSKARTREGNTATNCSYRHIQHKQQRRLFAVHQVVSQHAVNEAHLNIRICTRATACATLRTDCGTG